MAQTPVQTARATWQDIYTLGVGTDLTTANYTRNSVYSGAAALLLNEHPHLSSGQTVIEKEKTTGASEGLVGTGMEMQQGHKVPTVPLSFDATSHNVVQFLKAFFHNGYEIIEGATYNSVGYHAVFHRYTNPNPTNFLTLVRKFSDDTANSHRLFGGIVTSFGLSANENENTTVSIELTGRDISYEYTWNADGGDTDSFDTTLDPLQWKNAHLAVGTIFEGYPGCTAACPASTTVTLIGAPDMTGLVEVGSYIVFESAPNTKHKIITVAASTLTLEAAATATFAATPRFKILNMMHSSGINFTLNNNAAPKAYDEQSIERFVLGRISGEGSINIPFSEISAGQGGLIASVGFTGSKWLKLFLEGGVLRLHLWWGDIFDAVEDSIGDGDLGFSLTIRASGEGIEDENGELAVSVPFTIRGDRYTAGTVLNKLGAAAGGRDGFYAVSGTGVDWVAQGSEILITNPEIGIHRGDTIVSGSASAEIRYMASTSYLYTWNYLSTLSGATGAGYTIKGDSVRIKSGFGLWRPDVTA